VFIERVEVVSSDGGAGGLAEGSAFFEGGGSSHLDPVAITRPGSVVEVVPSLESGEPGIDSLPGNEALVIADESYKEEEGGGHTV
jgi:hypothetical protein